MMAPANGLAFSCRERAGVELQKANDLAREAVNCNAVLGGVVRLIAACPTGHIARLCYGYD